MPDIKQEAIRPFAFLVALISAPLATAIPGFAVLFFSGVAESTFGPFLVLSYFLVGALFVGGIPYLLVGIPGLIHALRKWGRDAPTGRCAFFGHILSCPPIFLIALMIERGDAFGFMIFYLVIGSLFAPLWGTLFSTFYNCILDRGQAAHV